jgi:hypothetical protein
MKSMLISYFRTIELKNQNVHEEYIINIKKMLKNIYTKIVPFKINSQL